MSSISKLVFPGCAVLLFALASSLPFSMQVARAMPTAVLQPSSNSDILRHSGVVILVKKKAPTRAQRLEACLLNARSTFEDMTADCRRNFLIGSKIIISAEYTQCMEFAETWYAAEQRGCRQNPG